MSNNRNATTTHAAKNAASEITGHDYAHVLMPRPLALALAAPLGTSPGHRLYRSRSKPHWGLRHISTCAHPLGIPIGIHIITFIISSMLKQNLSQTTS